MAYDPDRIESITTSSWAPRPSWQVSAFFGSSAFLTSAGLVSAGLGAGPLALRTSAMAFLRIAARCSYYCLSPALGLTIRTSWT